MPRKNRKIQKPPKETPLEFFSRLRGTGIKFERRKDLPRPRLKLEGGPLLLKWLRGEWPDKK
jgi:hypothetical protein